MVAYTEYHLKHSLQGSVMMSRKVLLLIFIYMFGVQAFAHGSMEIPISRIYQCFKEGPENLTSEVCKSFVAMSGKQPLYDWDMVNQFNAADNHKAVVPDGTLCAGGRDKYAGLNMTRTDWLTTKLTPDVNGQVNLVFRATVPHASKYFRFYLTKDSYDFSKPLKWDDLDPPFCEFLNDPPLENGRYNFNCALPTNKSGRRILYMIWQRRDSAEAFYACSDVLLGDEVAIQWKALSNLTATTSVKENTRVAIWLMKDCQDVESHTVQMTGGQTSASAWPYQLALRVNANSSIMRIGQLNNQTGEVVPVQSATENTVYVKDNDTSAYFYILDFLPAAQTILNNPEGRRQYCLQHRK